MLHDMAEKSHLTIIQTLKSIIISKHKKCIAAQREKNNIRVKATSRKPVENLFDVTTYAWQ